MFSDVVWETSFTGLHHYSEGCEVWRDHPSGLENLSPFPDCGLDCPTHWQLACSCKTPVFPQSIPLLHMPPPATPWTLSWTHYFLPQTCTTSFINSFGGGRLPHIIHALLCFPPHLVCYPGCGFTLQSLPPLFYHHFSSLRGIFLICPLHCELGVSNKPMPFHASTSLHKLFSPPGYTLPLNCLGNS